MPLRVDPVYDAALCASVGQVVTLWRKLAAAGIMINELIMLN